MVWQSKLLIGALGILLISLQLRLWWGDGGFAELNQLSHAIERQQSENHALQQRNDRLRAEVEALKEGRDALEGKARHDLGMIKNGETFFFVTDS